MPQSVGLSPVTPPPDPRPANPAPTQSDSEANFQAALKQAHKHKSEASKATKDAGPVKPVATATAKAAPKPAPKQPATPDPNAAAPKPAPATGKARPALAGDASDDGDYPDGADPAADQKSAKLPTATNIETAATADEHPVHAKAKPTPRGKNPDGAPILKNPDTVAAKPTPADATAADGDPSDTVDALNPDGKSSQDDDASAQGADVPGAPKLGGAIRGETPSEQALVSQDSANAADTAHSDDSAAPPDPTASAPVLPESSPPAPSVGPPTHATGTFADALASVQAPPATKATAQAVKAVQPAPPPPAERQFATANHTNIVKGIQTQLLPNGGTMQIRLDPAELGAMNVSVHMRDGVMTATFETTSDHASRLLSHSLGDLKTSLESAGVTIGGLHVQQAAPTHAGSNTPDGNQKNSDQPQDQPSHKQQQEQQRREMVRRMWKKLNGGKDPLDLVA